MAFIWFISGFIVSWFLCSLLTLAKETDLYSENLRLVNENMRLEFENMKLREEIEND